MTDWSHQYSRNFSPQRSQITCFTWGLVGQCFTKRPVGDAAGSKGLPEGFARILGHDVLAVIAGDQHHDMVGTLPAFVTAMDFTRRILVVRVAHKEAREERETPIIYLSTWLSISPCRRSEQPHVLACCWLAEGVNYQGAGVSPCRNIRFKPTRAECWHGQARLLR